MSGQWWENDLIVGPFADIPAANAWAAANPSSLFPGLLATAGGVQIRWGGSGWVDILTRRDITANVYARSRRFSSTDITISPAADGTGYPNVVNDFSDGTSDFISIYGVTSGFVTSQNRVPSGNNEILIARYAFSVYGNFQCVFYGDGETLKMWVDGEVVNTAQVLANSASTRLNFTFATTRRRDIVFECQQISGIRTVIKDAIKKIIEPSTMRDLILISDSWGCGGLNIVKRSDLWVHQFAQKSCMRNVYNCSASGTGFATANGLSEAFGSQSRLDTDLTGISGDPLIIVSGSINDNGKSASAVTEGAESLFSYLKGRFKNSEALVVGPQILSAQSPSSALANEDLIFASARARGYRTVSTNGWFTGTGNSGTPAGDGNQDLFLGSDAAHMTAIGHQYFADKVFDAFMS